MRFIKWLFSWIRFEASAIDPVDQAAINLMIFMRQSISPMDAADGQEDEWPLSIVAADVETAMVMLGALEDLERALRAKGHDLKYLLTEDTE